MKAPQSLIPISPDEKIPFTDEETGITYQFRPICGELEFQIAIESSKLPKAEGEDAIRSYFAYRDSLLDRLVCGWGGEAVKKTPFPADGKPSRFMTTALKNKLLRFVKEMRGLSDDEVKN